MGILQHPVRHPPGSLWGDSSRIFAPAPMVALWATPSSQWRFTCSVRTSSGKTRALGSLPSYMHQLKGMSPLVRTWQNAVRNLNTKHADSSQIYICLDLSLGVYFCIFYICILHISSCMFNRHLRFNMSKTELQFLPVPHHFRWPARLSQALHSVNGNFFFQLSRLKFWDHPRLHSSFYIPPQIYQEVLLTPPSK